MTTIASQLREMLCRGELALPLPGQGQTALRHSKLSDIAREDLSLGRLAEGHVDATAILGDAGRQPEPGALYAVWASENASADALQARRDDGCLRLSGTKMFCSGSGLVDRALMTIGTPEPLLLDVDLRSRDGALDIQKSDWKSTAFAETQTATIRFDNFAVRNEDVVHTRDWYLSRPGFWHGACGPASCWAGGAAALADYARRQTRDNPHAMAHLGAIESLVWAIHTCLKGAGDEIDMLPGDAVAACNRALMLRHVIEQSCTEVLSRFSRAYGPRPLVFVEKTARLHLELQIYIRQCHGEVDLEAIGRQVASSRDHLYSAIEARGSATVLGTKNRTVAPSEVDSTTSMLLSP